MGQGLANGLVALLAYMEKHPVLHIDGTNAGLNQVADALNMSPTFLQAVVRYGVRHKRLPSLSDKPEFRRGGTTAEQVVGLIKYNDELQTAAAAQPPKPNATPRRPTAAERRRARSATAAASDSQPRVVGPSRRARRQSKPAATVAIVSTVVEAPAAPSIDIGADLPSYLTQALIALQSAVSAVVGCWGRIEPSVVRRTVILEALPGASKEQATRLDTLLGRLGLRVICDEWGMSCSHVSMVVTEVTLEMTIRFDASPTIPASQRPAANKAAVHTIELEPVAVQAAPTREEVVSSSASSDELVVPSTSPESPTLTPWLSQMSPAFLEVLLEVQEFLAARS